jgi:hypothetical protein
MFKGAKTIMLTRHGRNSSRDVVSLPNSSNTAGAVGRVADDGRRWGRLTVNRFPNFLAMNRHIFRRDNAKPHFVAADFDDRDRDIVVNHDALVFFSGQDKHRCVSFCGSEVPRLVAFTTGTSGPPSSRRNEVVETPRSASSLHMGSSSVDVALRTDAIDLNLLLFTVTGIIISVKRSPRKLPILKLYYYSCNIVIFCALEFLS